MFVSFLYIYNMFLNIPNHPRCFDCDGMPALTLAGVVSASLGTNFAWGGVCRFSQEPKKFHIPFIWIKTPEWYTEPVEGPVLVTLFPHIVIPDLFGDFLPLRHPRPSGRGSIHL